MRDGVGSAVIRRARYGIADSSPPERTTAFAVEQIARMNARKMGGGP